MRNRKTIKLNTLICSAIACFLFQGINAPEVSADDSAVNTGGAPVIDASCDQNEYGAIVSDINRYGLDGLVNGASSNDIPGQNSAEPVLVLCRTEPRTEIDFSGLNASCVIAGPSDCYTLVFTDPESAQSSVDALLKQSGIKYAELDDYVTACGEETSYSFHSRGAESMNYGAYLEYCGAWIEENNATVAVIDSGVYLHTDIQDHVKESGYDYVDSDYDSTNDLFGHGTHVAGIISDCAQDMPVNILPIRVLNSSGKGKISNVVNAVREAAEKGVEVINLSLESKVLSEALDDAISYAVENGCTVVAAAGNSAVDTVSICPAHITVPGVIVVGACEEDGTRSSYSNYGDSVDLYTYGTDISSCSLSGDYSNSSGTSMAAPHISALAALLSCLHPDALPAEIEQRIVQTCTSGICAPNLVKTIPLRYPFALTQIQLSLADSLVLPEYSVPCSAKEKIIYSVLNENIVEIAGGVVTPKQTGETEICISSFGLETVCFTVSVDDTDPSDIFVFPKGLTELDDEAFLGNPEITQIVLPDGLLTLGNRVFENCSGLRSVQLPASLLSIGDNTFSGALVLCNTDSAAEEYAMENSLQYIAYENK